MTDACKSNVDCVVSYM